MTAMGFKPAIFWSREGHPNHSATDFDTTCLLCYCADFLLSVHVVNLFVDHFSAGPLVFPDSDKNSTPIEKDLPPASEILPIFGNTCLYCACTD